MSRRASSRARDVAVVGGGPAGCAAAHRLARAGLDVLVLEKEHPPRYKTCGGAVVRRALPHLPCEIDAVVEREFSMAACHLLGAGLRLDARRREPFLFMTMRERLDHLLLEAALAAGAEVLSGEEVTGLAFEEGGVRLDTPSGGLRARCVVAADGVLGPVARLAGLPDGRHLAPALEWEVRVPAGVRAAFGRVPRFDFDAVPRGYAWVFPKAAHLSVGALSTRRGASDLKGTLARYLHTIGVGPVESVEAHGHLIPLRPRTGPMAHRGVFLTGDAAGLADPLTAEGISFAAESGRLAAEAILQGGGRPGEAEERYQEGLESGILRELRVGRLVARLVYGPPGVRRALLRLHGHRLAGAVAAVFAGELTYRGIVRDPVNYLRLLRPMG